MSLGWDWKIVLVGVPGLFRVVIISQVTYAVLNYGQLADSSLWPVEFSTQIFGLQIRDFHFTNYRLSFSTQMSISQIIDFEFICI